MALGDTEDAARRGAELVRDGKVTEEDFTAIVGPLEAFIDTRGRVGVLAVLRRHGGFWAGTLWTGSGSIRRP